MITFPIKVIRRDSTGAKAEVLCDTAQGALSNAKHFRDAGNSNVWIEDHEGRKVSEEQLSD